MTETMLAQVLHAVGDMRYERLPVPDVPDGWALIQVAYCGVCGSDIPRVFVKGTYHFPTVIGHEFAGTVTSMNGDGPFTPGDRVAVFPLIWCGQCAACERGHFVMCRDYDYLGSRRNGAFAEYVAAPIRNLVAVPDGVSLEDAAMTEPASVALHALRRVGHPLIGATAVVFGAGPIGLMVCQWARAMGAARVYVFDVIPQKLDLARSIDVDGAFDSRERPPQSVIDEMTDGAGAHVCVDAAGVPSTLTAAIECARPGGTVVILGNPSADVTLPQSLISQSMRRELALLGTWNSAYSATGNDDDWSTALSAMATRKLRLRPLVSHVVSLSGVWSTLQMIHNRTEFVSKVLVSPTATEVGQGG